MKRYLFNGLVAIFAAMTLLLSCQREDILYNTGNYYLGLSVVASAEDESVLSSMYLVNFYDTNTGKCVYSTYLRPDLHPAGFPAGGYVIGVEPGEYDLLVYDMGTQVSDVREADRFDRVYATATLAGRVNDTPVLNNPDPMHFFASRVTVPYITDKDQVYIIEAPLRDAVQHWTVHVDGISNADIAESVWFYISGQEEGYYLGLDTPIGNRAVVLFPGHAVVETKAGGDKVDAEFGTFGVDNAAERYLLTAVVTGPNGSVYYGQADVTEQVILGYTSGSNEINATITMEVEPRSQGGFDPKAEPWDPDVTIIILE